jgi:hypothetical protein
LTHYASADFWACYRSLPQEIQKLEDAAYPRLKQDPRHPSLHFKKVGRFWSARAGGQYRALAVETGDNLVWFRIGSHADYDKAARLTTAST